MAGNPEAYAAFKIKLESLPENIIVIASHTQTDSRKEKVSDYSPCLPETTPKQPNMHGHKLFIFEHALSNL